jgi:putative acetyltransferase
VARVQIVVRRERPADHTAVDALTRAAFGQAVEAALLRRLRRCDEFVPELSLVAEADGEIAGHVICTRGRLGDGRALGLGPISVAPDRRHRGIGSALMHAVIGAADALGEPVIALLGEPGFYGRFGFRPAGALDIEAPDPTWGDYFQARALHAWTPGPRRAFEYAEPFKNL